jgi:citrate synthase
MAQSRGVAPPNLDFTLAALTHVLKLPVGSGEALFTVARMVGWLAHALEEYARRTDFRLRAVYTGPRPEEGEEGEKGERDKRGRAENAARA